MIPQRRRIAVVGGGISGLTAAYELSRAGADAADVVLFEAAPRLGGIVETVRDGGFTIECGPDAWVAEKPWARTLMEELGLGAEVIPSNDHLKRTYIAQDGKLAPLPDGMRMMVPTRWEPLLHSPLFSWGAKLAFLREPRLAHQLRETALLARGENADEPVADFVARHFGPEVVDRVAGPLLAGIFGGDIRQLSARAVMAPFVKMEAQTGSLITALQSSRGGGETSTFASLAGGLQTFIDALVHSMPGVRLRLSTPVQALRFDGAQWTVQCESGAERFDEVFVATSLQATRALLLSAERDACRQMAALLPAHASSAVLAALCFPAPARERLRIPRGFGFLVPPLGRPEGSQERLLACTFADQKFASRAPEGAVLLRAFFGGAAAESLSRESDEYVTATALRQLSRLLGPMPEPTVSVVRRWPGSLPQYAVGHLQRVARLEQHAAQMPGLHLLGNSYRGVGLPDLVRDARAAARRALGA